MIEELKKLRSKIKIGIVGGSDMSKQYEQLGKTGMHIYVISRE